jgi:ACR3 family arsenite efflux pump ArsB
MSDYISMGADLALAAVAIIGIYYAIECANLFRGDLIMQRVWRLATAAFVILAFFSVLDFLLTFANNPLGQYHLVRVATVFAIGAFAAAAMVLVRWGRSSTEPRTQQSGQYPQR